MLKNRYRRIVLFFAQLLLNFAVWDVLLPRIGLRRLSRRTRPSRLHSAASQFRTLAVQMGGVLIKVGQFFSARVDVLPAEVTDELSGLQDEVPQENFEAIRKVVESEFGLPLQAMFAEFSPAPEAAASLGQVHRAKLVAPAEGGPEGFKLGDDGRLEVVVKVQRPDIERLIATDLAALRTVGKWLERYRPVSRRANIPALLAEFTRILYEEIDYNAEGHNAETFAANFRDRPGVRVPQVVWSHTTKRVLTLEDVRAIKISDYAAITAAGIDLADVAERLFQTYLVQIFEDGFFHADPHPGNLFISPQLEVGATEIRDPLQSQPEWLLTFVDFGMVGREPPNLRAGLRELVIAIGTRDPARMVTSYQMLGVLLPGADLELLEKIEAKVFEQFWGKTMSELVRITPQEVGEFLKEFRHLIYNMPFQIPEDLILLGRSVGILSGMCTGLNPDFNVWEGLAPYAQKLISEELAAQPKAWFAELEKLLRNLLAYPRRVGDLMDTLDRGELVVQIPEVSAQISRLERSVNRATGGVIFAALLFAGVQLYLSGELLFGSILIALAGLALLWVIRLGKK